MRAHGWTVPALVASLALSAASPSMSPRAPVLPAQAPYCASGPRICIVGWVWECQCFSYGCQYVTTAWRCDRRH